MAISERHRVDSNQETSTAEPLPQPSGFDNPAMVPEGPFETDTADRETVDALVSKFISDLAEKFPKRVLYRPHALRNRVIRLIDASLGPHRPAGRPKLQRVTRATEMYRQQLAEVKAGARKEVNWQAIAIECIPGFEKIRSDYRRTVEVKRLRDAVHARDGRAKNRGQALRTQVRV